MTDDETEKVFIISKNVCREIRPGYEIGPMLVKWKTNTVITCANNSRLNRLYVRFVLLPIWRLLHWGQR